MWSTLNKAPVGVGGGKNSGWQGQLNCGCATVVAGAVAAFVVLSGKLRHFGQGRDAGEYALAVVRVQPGLVTLGPTQGSLVQIRLDTPARPRSWRYPAMRSTRTSWPDNRGCRSGRRQVADAGGVTMQ